MELIAGTKEGTEMSSNFRTDDSQVCKAQGQLWMVEHISLKV